MLRIVTLCALLVASCNLPDYTTSQGVAVYLDCGGDWIDQEIIDLGFDSDFDLPTRDRIEDALEFLATEGADILGESEKYIRHVLRYSTLHLRGDRADCGRWTACAGCRFDGNRHVVKWYGKAYRPPFFHEFMHSIRPGVTHKLKDEPDSPHDPWWDNQNVLNIRYRDLVENKQEY